MFTGRFNRPPVEVLFDRESPSGERDRAPAHPAPFTHHDREDREVHRALRTEFRTDRVFTDLATAQHELDEWVHDYNHDRPHQALDMATPASTIPSLTQRP